MLTENAYRGVLDAWYVADWGGRRHDSPLEGESQKPSVFCAKADAVRGMLLK